VPDCGLYILCMISYHPVDVVTVRALDPPKSHYISSFTDALVRYKGPIKHEKQ